MSKAHDTVFTPYATGEDVSYLFGITAAVDEDNVFSSTSIPSLAKQILSRPVEVFPGFTNDGSKTIFESATVDVPSSPVSTILSILEDVTLDTIPEDDLWQHADLDTRPSKKTNTWESFGASRDNFDIKVNPFLTEQRPQVFDELLRRHLNHIHAPNESGTVVDERLFRECLLASCLGQESLLFQWKQEVGFESILENVRVLDITPAASKSIASQMCRRGTLFRRLNEAAEMVLRSPTKYGSIAVSFCRSIISITQHWQSQIQESYSPSTQGILTLQLQFSDIDDALNELAELCSCTKPVQPNTPSPHVGGDLLTQLYTTALKYDYPTSSSLRPLSLALLKQTSLVFLDLLTYWIGFPAAPRGFSDIKEWYNMDTAGEFFIQRMPTGDVATSNSMTEFDSFFQFDDKSVPAFITKEEAVKVYETGFGLRLLWRCLPEHPLCDVFDVAKNVNETLELRWRLSWDEIHAKHERLDKYAGSTWTAIDSYKQHSDVRKESTSPPAIVTEEATEFGFFESKEAASRMLSSRIEEMSLLPQQTSQDTFVTDFTSLHYTTTSIPLLSLVAQNSFTRAIEIQANLVQHALLSLFFNTLNLQQHLATLHSHFLFGDGTFVQRIQEALFEDFDVEDVRSGGQTGLGLGIGLKSEWPPNGGKVGLVLRTLLSETTELSFSYREMSDSQFDKVKNPIGLEALDFLELQYKPPFPLDAVITASILERYDRIFLFLIKLFRMQYVVHQLFRDSASRTSYAQGVNPLAQRFRIEAHHFITAISQYMMQVAVTGNWHTFTNTLSRIHQSLETHDAKVFSISEVRELHSKTVDRMTYCCFLKKKQSPILALLYGTFEPVLLFAKISRLYARREQRVWSRMREEMEDNTRILYAQFGKRAGMFVRVVQQMRNRGIGKGEDKGEYEGGWFADLLVRLDGSYFDR